ncbi:methyltransferase domain-containing protein [Accumulibacter sp.]|uniref:methyltransferase domain-containing protein n=1 Tax=Accumulibacter sp. TaxID=2053492 RepID=UPI0025E2E4C8|nr:methyltransferase domain-containing protein [Accumulibacter sp.]MCM8612109.1 class I SAM-dependent methyltransferase [Accumulibacter sp.]MCM8635775.1 class I SAM-dependent methyltransferase [Accumulibacter sp.]MCM8639588.1 class I SAM-dependent methyltransferase [Accumulibacter sp.]
MASCGPDPISRNACPACGSSEIIEIPSGDVLPAILFPVESARAADVPARAIRAAACSECQHVFLTQIDPDFSARLYADYYNLYPFRTLETLNVFYREPFDEVLRVFCQPGSHSLLEIGCDDVQQMRYFLDQGYRCTAINPGAEDCGDVHFIDGYYGLTVVEGDFDRIISRFNLEHIVDIDAFFEQLQHNLKGNGIAIVQVPNAQHFLHLGVLNMFAHEHPHYFCRRSLAAMISSRGFEIRFLNGAGEPSLICAFAHGTDNTYDPLARIGNLRRVISQVCAFIADRSDRVVLYGAGLSATALLYWSEFRAEWYDRLSIVDDNVVIQGRLMPNTPLAIGRPDDKVLQGASSIILTLSQQYHPTVIGRLRARGVAADIYAISDNGFKAVSRDD